MIHEAGNDSHELFTMCGEEDSQPKQILLTYTFSSFAILSISIVWRPNHKPNLHAVLITDRVGHSFS
jgi:hypothetical protein